MSEEIDRLRLQLSLLETEQQNLRQILDRAALNEKLDRFSISMIIEADIETGRIIDANDIACELLGYSLAEFRARNITEIEVMLNTSPQDIRRYFETSIETFVYECYYRQRDGRLTPVRVHKRAMRHEDPPVMHYTLEDRSLRHRVVQELNRREDSDFHYREKMVALNRISAEMAVTDSIAEVCKIAVHGGIEWLGFDRLSIWMYDSQSNQMHGTYGTDEHGAVRDEHNVKWAVGHSPVTAYLNGRQEPIVTPDNAPIYNNDSEIIGFGWHISAPLLHEGRFIGYMTADNYLRGQPLRSYQPELLRSFAATVGHFCAHQRNREANREMAEAARRLADAVRMNQERIQMLGTFISHISHDFRTPLTLINTNTYLLRKTNDEARKRELARKIEQQVDYVNRVVNEMLEVVTLEEQVDFNLTPIDIAEILNNVSLFVAGLADDKDIEFLFDEPTHFYHYADARWLERAVRELLLNAVQFTNPGGQISLTLSLAEHELVIRIQDTGIGIPPAEQEKIFQHLYRVDSARTMPGVGLGLTLAKLIVEAHSGTIRLESAPNVGSTFDIVLPRISPASSVETERVHPGDTAPLRLDDDID